MQNHGQRAKHHGERRLLAASLILALSVPFAASAADSSTQAWASTRTEAFQSGAAQFQGYAEDGQTVSIAVSLKVRDPDALNNYTHELFRPNSLVYHRFLTKEQSEATFSPTAEQAEAVAAYLKKQGFTNVEIAPNRLVVTADGDVGKARSAFRTTIARFNVQGVNGIANDSAVQVPAELSQIDQVVGLDTTQKMQTYSLPAAQLKPAYVTTSSGGHGYYPQEFATVYHAGTVARASNTAAAVIGWGSMTNAQADLAHFISDKGLPAVPSSIVATASSSDDSGQVEWAMDAQAITGVSGGVKSLTFYTSGTNSNSAILKALNRAVSDNTAKVLNMSWGAAECGSTTKGFADSVFQLGVSQGQTFVASSGDNGSYPCNASANGAYGSKTILSVSYPASSPYVAAVGGTTLNTDTSDNYVSETSWPYSGGGTSTAEATPSWQTGAHRQVPDLAFDADWDKSPIIFYLTKSSTSGVGTSGYYANGGTSLAAPLFSGSWARLESANANAIGFAPPAIYAYAKSTTTPLPLHDVASGTNGGYSATKGYDLATGWGSFDIQAVANFITANPGFINASNP